MKTQSVFETEVKDMNKQLVNAQLDNWGELYEDTDCENALTEYEAWSGIRVILENTKRPNNKIKQYIASL